MNVDGEKQRTGSRDNVKHLERNDQLFAFRGWGRVAWWTRKRQWWNM